MASGSIVGHRFKAGGRDRSLAKRGADHPHIAGWSAASGAGPDMPLYVAVAVFPACPFSIIGFPAPSHLRRLFQPDACHVSLTSYSLGSPLSQVDRMTSATTNILFFYPGPSPTPLSTLTQHLASRAEISLTRRGQRIQLDQMHGSQRTGPLPGPGPETV